MRPPREDRGASSTAGSTGGRAVVGAARRVLGLDALAVAALGGAFAAVVLAEEALALVTDAVAARSRAVVGAAHALELIAGPVATVVGLTAAATTCCGVEQSGSSSGS